MNAKTLLRAMALSMLLLLPGLMKAQSVKVKKIDFAAYGCDPLIALDDEVRRKDPGQYNIPCTGCNFEYPKLINGYPVQQTHGNPWMTNVPHALVLRTIDLEDGVHNSGAAIKYPFEKNKKYTIAFRSWCSLDDWDHSNAPTPMAVLHAVVTNNPVFAGCWDKFIPISAPNSIAWQFGYTVRGQMEEPVMTFSPTTCYNYLWLGTSMFDSTSKNCSSHISMFTVTITEIDVHEIVGDQRFCSSANYSLTNLKPEETVTWSTSPNLTVTAGQGTSAVKISGTANGPGYIEATISNPANPCQTPGKVRKDVRTVIGVPDNTKLSITAYTLCPGKWNDVSAKYNGGCFATADIVDAQWSTGWYDNAEFNGDVMGSCSPGDYSGMRAMPRPGSRQAVIGINVANLCGWSGMSKMKIVPVYDGPSGSCSGGGGTFAMTVAPNPARQQINITIDKSTLDKSVVPVAMNKAAVSAQAYYKVTLTDLMGNVKYIRQFPADQSLLQVQPTGIPDGEYVLRVEGDGVSNSRIVRFAN
ncbi:hypothetical protein [Chitinophaga nivalis]|uniref:Secretion system C-terminal sorting domain-containing protein n=1 Tax=Chitinophaga nivalis TaxID=2991709 RepID=A0ABT3IFS6_9BACT|nr:hypothetical protein [Chitinophaga nivalis]MCW3467502.1 hypothetical protein [Chitinophaga nivalis]MCW3482806.1 hypothetical protein [Chitinophaga nivalis]